MSYNYDEPYTAYSSGRGGLFDAAAFDGHCRNRDSCAMAFLDDPPPIRGDNRHGGRYAKQGAAEMTTTLAPEAPKRLEASGSPRIFCLPEVRADGRKIFPGQFISAWDIKRWIPSRQIEASLVTAVESQGRLVTLDGPRPRTATVEEGLREYAEEDPDYEGTEFFHICQSTLLGNMGGRRKVLPDVQCPGVLPSEARDYRGIPTSRANDLSIVEWYRSVRQAPLEESSAMPRPAFFVKSEGGRHQGLDVGTGEMGAWRKVIVPFSWITLWEMGLAKDEFEMGQVMLLLSGHFRGMAAHERWGDIYIGWVGQGPADAVYSVRYADTNPWRNIQGDVVAQLKPLLD